MQTYLDAGTGTDWVICVCGHRQADLTAAPWCDVPDDLTPPRVDGFVNVFDRHRGVLDRGHVIAVVDVDRSTIEAAVHAGALSPEVLEVRRVLMFETWEQEGRGRRLESDGERCFPSLAGMVVLEAGEASITMAPREFAGEVFVAWTEMSAAYGTMIDVTVYPARLTAKGRATLAQGTHERA